MIDKYESSQQREQIIGENKPASFEQAQPITYKPTEKSPTQAAESDTDGDYSGQSIPS